MSQWGSSHLDAAARRLVAIAELDEVGVTGVVRQAVQMTGGELVGLDHRVKTVESLARKLADLVGQDPDLGVAEAGSEVFDVLRYTVVADTEHYLDVHAAVLGRLRAEGVEVVLEANRWEGPGYRGINVGFVTATGVSSCSSTPGRASRPPEPPGGTTNNAGGTRHLRTARTSYDT